MKNIETINENILRLTIPYKDIFTTVYLVKTVDGALLFDAASFDEDVDDYIVPFLKEQNISQNELKYVYISHHHIDHSGGLERLMKFFPKTKIVSTNDALVDKFGNDVILKTQDGDVLLNDLKVVKIPGHTKDSAAILDTRYNIVISGDCLQLYGIFGSGNWACNISFPVEHIEAIKKVKKMNIDAIYTAHDYHPFGYKYIGRDTIVQALDSCILPLYEIKSMTLKFPNLTDEEIAEIYNSNNNPKLGAHVVNAVRNAKISF